MVLTTAAERRSPRDPLIFPVRWEAPDPPPPSPLAKIPPNLHETRIKTWLCSNCGQVSALGSVYPIEFRHNLISCLLRCWACGHDFFKPKSALRLADSASRSLRHDAQDAVRSYKG